MSRSLVIAPQWIGDAVMSEPLLRRLARRGERLSVGALPWVAPVYRAMPQVGEVIEMPFAHGRLDASARRAMAASFKGRFDRAYVLPNSIKSALIPWLARIPRRIGYLGEKRYLLLNERLANVADRPPMVAFYSALSGEAVDAAERPQLQLAPGAIAAATAEADVREAAYWVFAPGAEYGPAKRWPAPHFAQLARSLHAAHALPVLLLGSAKEAALCEEIAAAAPGACRVLAGRTTLDAAMALIAGARGVVSNDSGLMHVAAAFGKPQVALFGSSSPEHTPPLNDKAQVVWLKHEIGLDCSPCFDRTCRFGHTRCLVEIAPARVEAAMEQLQPRG
jgi:heptosyltransferase-2